MLLNLDHILENKKTYISKYKDQPGISQVVDQFWKIKSRLSSPQNDIDWWISRPFNEFKEFVNNFEHTTKTERRQTALLAELSNLGADMLGTKSGYEIWYVPNYSSSCILGRNYKNRPTHWCISSDDPSYWFENYDQSEFIFLIRQNLQYDDYDKVAIQFEDGGRYFDIDQISVWDLQDNDEYDSSIITYDLLKYCWELFKDSGCMKDDTVY